MNIKKNCDFCSKILNNKLMYDGYYYVTNYRKDFDNYSDICIFLSNKNKFICSVCLKEYVTLVNMNKINFIKKRQIFGIKHKSLKLPLKDKKKIKYIFGELKEYCCPNNSLR